MVGSGFVLLCALVFVRFAYCFVVAFFLLFLFPRSAYASFCCCCCCCFVLFGFFMCAPSEVFSYAPHTERERERESGDGGWGGGGGGGGVGGWGVLREYTRIIFSGSFIDMVVQGILLAPDLPTTLSCAVFV